MAEILRSYDWSASSKHTDSSRAIKYPWAEWLDGRIRRLIKGEDFYGTAISVERVIRTSANRQKVRVRVRVEDENTIVLQAHTDNAREMERKVTKSPSRAAVKEAAEAKAAGKGNGVAAAPVKSARQVYREVTKKAAAPARPSKRAVSGNGSKPTKRALVKSGA